MGQVHMNGPEPDDTACPVCLMQAKQRQWERFADDIQAGLKAPDDDVAWIPWPGDLLIRTAEYVAVPGDVPQMGLLKICWDHVAGLGPAPSVRQLLEAPGPLPPGLAKGDGRGRT